jgi:IMP dehydrogenase
MQRSGAMINGPLEEGLTFDDVLLVPAKSEVHPREVDISAELTKRIRINVPLVSAAMDTVTEARLAIALAREGGIGMIHRAFSMERQAAEVDKVKKSESGMIVDPITVRPTQKIQEALEIMERYRISGVPVTDEEGRLQGILTNRDLRFETKLDLPISALMTRDRLVTAPVGTSLEEAKEILHQHRIEKLPVVDEQFKLKGLITIKDIEKRRKYPHACKDALGRLRVGAAVGVEEDAEARVPLLLKAGVDVVVVDTAHGHSQSVIETVRWIKRAHPQAEVIAGNVATAEGAEDLIQAGVDGIKVGIGPGSICTTRVVAGAGVPQVTGIARCAAVTDRHGIPIISDGGVKYSGDITKAIAAGARTVMIGGLFAGTEESPGETVIYQGRSYKVYRGMGSLGAMQRGGRDRYFQEADTEEGKLVPEGIEGRVPYRGTLAANVFQMVGGLKAGMGYCGCRSVEELRQHGRFIKITNAGLRESHVHDVIITKEAPNYRMES